MDDDNFLQMVLIVNYLQSNRYLKSRRNSIAKSLVFYDDVLPALPEDRFQQFFRMSRESFLYVLSKIEGNAVFGNNSNFQQAPPAKQLAVTLRWLCSESLVAASCINIAQTFGIGEGTVISKKYLRILRIIIQKDHYAHFMSYVAFHGPLTGFHGQTSRNLGFHSQTTHNLGFYTCILDSTHVPVLREIASYAYAGYCTYQWPCVPGNIVSWFIRPRERLSAIP